MFGKNYKIICVPSTQLREIRHWKEERKWGLKKNWKLSFLGNRFQRFAVQ